MLVLAAATITTVEAMVAATAVDMAVDNVARLATHVEAMVYANSRAWMLLC
jgi:hypothetical protein